MAFVRFKGPYAYLVVNARAGRGKNSRVAQKVLCYLGRGPDLDAATVAKVGARFPEVKVDWDAVRRELSAGASSRAATSKATARKGRRGGEEPAAAGIPGGREDWSDWD